MKNVQQGEFVKLGRDGLAKRGNHEPAQIGKGSEPRCRYGFKGMEVSSNGLGQFPIKKGLLIGIEKRALGLPLSDKVHFSDGLAVLPGPALVNVLAKRKHAGVGIKPPCRTLPAGVGGPRKLDPAVEVLLAQQLRGADLAESARGSADQRFGDPGLALLNVQVGGSPVAKTSPMQAGKTVQMGKWH